MKTIKYISGFVLATLLTVVSCDKIKDNDRLIDQGVVKIESERCVLLEDYTGVKCVNCPDAAAIVEELQAVYGKNLVVVEMHPTGNSQTSPIGNDQDLRTETAGEYYTEYKITSLPKGLVNRKSYGGNVTLERGDWGAAVAGIFENEETDYVNLAASASISGDNIRISINGNFKKDYPEEGEINVLAWVVEDNIVTRQSSHGTTLKEYAHHHVFRAVASSGIWGDKVLDAKPAEDAEFSQECTTKLNDIWKKENLSVVVSVTNARTREVLQTAYVHAKE